MFSASAVLLDLCDEFADVLFISARLLRWRLEFPPTISRHAAGYSHQSMATVAMSNFWREYDGSPSGTSEKHLPCCVVRVNPETKLLTPILSTEDAKSSTRQHEEKSPTLTQRMLRAQDDCTERSHSRSTSRSGPTTTEVQTSHINTLKGQHINTTFTLPSGRSSSTTTSTDNTYVSSHTDRQEVESRTLL